MVKKSKEKLLTTALLYCFIILLFLMPIFAQGVDYENKTIEQLKADISAKKNAIKDLDAQSKEYEEAITAKQNEAASLKNQLAIIENRIAKTEVDIEAKELEIEEIQLEQVSIKLQINEQEEKINSQKEELAELIRLIYKKNQTNYLQVLLTKASFSAYFEEIKYLEKIQSEAGQSLTKVKRAKELLDLKKDTLEAKEQELVQLKKDLIYQKEDLEEKIFLKENLLEETRASEWRYQQLVAELKQEQEEVNATIAGLEEAVREKLRREQDGLAKLGPADLDWPVPKLKITSYFHDPDYPYRYIFEHPGLDLRAAQGTPVKAAGVGYVAKVRDAGMGYNYIMLVHGENISTVYGHLSKMIVEEGAYVTRGQVIGYSGGTPGTPGAGRLVTGAHLHFEVRLNGIPVDPLDHLPAW